MCELMFSEQSREQMLNGCQELDISPGLAKALHFLEPGERRPMKDLASAWHCDASYVTSLIDGLERRGFVERQPHPSDRRAKTVALTPAGEKVRAEMLEHWFEPPAFFAALSTAEQRSLRDLLRKALAAL